MPLGSKFTPPGGHNFTLNYIKKLQTTSFLKLLMGMWPNLTGMVLGWLPTKIVQMVLIGCICRSRGQKVGFQNAIFKNLLVWNYKAQSFHIYYIESSRGPLPKLFKLCPWGQNWPRPGGHNMTLNYIRKVQTTSSLEPIMVIWPNITGMIPGRSPTKVVQMVLIGCISRSRGQN